MSDVAQPFFVGTTCGKIALDDICGRRNRVIALRRSRMPLFDSFCADIRIIHDVRNGLHVDMNLPLAKLSMNAWRSIHAAGSFVLAAQFCRKRISSQ